MADENAEETGGCGTDGGGNGRRSCSAAAAELESAANKRAKIATLSKGNERRVQAYWPLGDLHKYAAHDPSPAIQRLALLSAVAVRDVLAIASAN